MGRKLIATLAGLGILAGCGGMSPVGRAGTAPVFSATSLSVAHCGGMSHHWQGLGLSDTQKASIREIIYKHHCGPKQTSQAMADLKAAMVAPTIDTAALTAALNAKIADRSAKIDKRVATLTDIRNVLTPEQRTKFAERKGKAGEGAGKEALKEGGKKHLDRLAEKLGLNQVQRQAFEDVGTAWKANKEEHHANRAARHQAIASFMKSGDADALKTALQAIKPSVPVDAMVKAIATLTQDQRKKLIEMKEQRHAKMCERLSKPRQKSALAAVDEAQADPAEESQAEESTEAAPQPQMPQADPPAESDTEMND